MKKTNLVFEGLKKGLTQAIDDVNGKPHENTRSSFIQITDIPQYRSKQIKRLRNNLNLTQNVFAKVMGVHVKTVEAWESGKNIPTGTAQRMLSLLEKDSTLLETHKILVTA